MYLSNRAPVIFEHDGAAVNEKLDGKFTSVAEATFDAAMTLCNRVFSAARKYRSR